jgi:hypothetical protein
LVPSKVSERTIIDGELGDWQIVVLQTDQLFELLQVEILQVL